MRTIKFRVWDNHNKQMLEDQEAKYWLSQGIQAEYLQFTGLLDKNGKEIYEGDIVKTGNMLGSVDWGEVFVDFGGEGHGEDFGNVITYVVKTKSAPEALSNLLVEIIGNIYEHEELLTNN